MVQDGELTAIRWVTKESKHDSYWGKWHLIKSGEVFTACGKVVKLFESDGSPQEGELSQVTCKQCLRAINKI